MKLSTLINLKDIRNKVRRTRYTRLCMPLSKPFGHCTTELNLILARKALRSSPMNTHYLLSMAVRIR